MTLRMALGGSTPITALVVTRDFHPVSHSGTIRVASLCRHLPSQGVSPIILTDEAPSSPDRDPVNGSAARRGAGTGEGERWLEETRVLRIPWSALNNAAYPRLRRVPMLATAVHKVRRARLTREALRAVSQVEAGSRPDIVFASCPPGDSLVVGAAISDHLGVPFIADYRDPWSHWPMPLYPHAVDFLAERSVEASLVPRCTRLLTTCEASRTLLIEQFGADPTRVVVIPNGYDEQEFDAAERLLPDRPDLFTIVYSGSIGRASSTSPSLINRFAHLAGFQFDPLGTNYNARSLYYFLQGLQQFYERTPEAHDRVRLCLVGASNTERDPVVRDFPYPELLEFYPRVRPELAVGACLQADLLLLTQLETFYDAKPLCVAIPAKLYTYLRSGRRILACAQKSEISELIAAESAGVTVCAHDPGAMANATAAEFLRWSNRAGSETPSLRECPQFERRQIAADVAQVMHEVLAGESSRQAGPVEVVGR